MTAVTKIEQDSQVMPADPMVSMIERVAMDPDADLEKLERMLELKRTHEEGLAKAAFASAFANAAAAFPTIPLRGMGHNNKPYATLKDITSLTRPVLSEHGLVLSFSIDVTDSVLVTAELMHKDGHSKSTSINLPKESSGSKNAVQAVGSSQTYGQRYTAQAILGLSLGEDTDDDGRSSGSPSEPPSKDPWTKTIVEEMPAGSSQRDIAVEICRAICAQFKRMKGERQLMNEWDRRKHLIEGDNGFEGKHSDLHETAVDAYENRIIEIKEAA